MSRPSATCRHPLQRRFIMKRYFAGLGVVTALLAGIGIIAA
jgi:hypothetical protein